MPTVLKERPMSFIQRMTDYSDPASFGSKMRRKRSKRLCLMIEDCYRRNGSVSIIDLGGEARYWDILGWDYLKKHNVSITLANKFEENLPDNPNPTLFTTLISDCCNLDVASKTFDIAHSNSVIEHLIDWEHMKMFVAHLKRVATSYYVQTPSFWFPIEPHFGAPFFHWLPEPTRIWLVLRRRMGTHPKAADIGWATDFVQNARLLTGKQMAYLFPDAQIVCEKFAGMTKSFTAVRDP
jgi:hypothetical protein